MTIRSSLVFCSVAVLGSFVSACSGTSSGGDDLFTGGTSAGGAAGAGASGGMNFANNAGQNIMSGGAARAAGLVGQSNALSGALSNLGNMGIQYAMFNRAFPQGSGVAINPMPSAPNYFGGS